MKKKKNSGVTGNIPNHDAFLRMNFLLQAATLTATFDCSHEKNKNYTGDSQEATQEKNVRKSRYKSNTETHQYAMVANHYSHTMRLISRRLVLRK